MRRTLRKSEQCRSANSTQIMILIMSHIDGQPISVHDWEKLLGHSTIYIKACQSIAGDVIVGLLRHIRATYLSVRSYAPC